MPNVDDVPPGSIRAAIWTVRTTPGLRTRPGYEAFDMVLMAPDQTIAHATLEKEFGTPNAHLGSFCRRVAEQLGISNPEEYALFDRTKDGSGVALLKLKPAVFLALTS